jgi:epsilon-lactone hydrolase
MPSFSARLVSFVLRSTGILKRQYAGGPNFPKTLAKVRARKVPEPHSRKLSIEKSEFQGRMVWTIAPKDRTPTASLLYWHGGGYVYPVSSAHWSFLCHMADVHGWSVTAPLYPLAPENTAAQITAWALDFYRMFMERKPSPPILMGGDSAGGGLTASTTMQARDEGLPLPDGLVLICPWLNAVPDNLEQLQIETRDPILSVTGITDCGVTFAGELPLTDYRVSPIYGEWHTLPPILCFGGGDDILVTDARALKAKKPDMNYDEQAGMIHVWPILSVPESRAAQRKMAQFACGLI